MALLNHAELHVRGGGKVDRAACDYADSYAAYIIGLLSVTPYFVHV